MGDRRDANVLLFSYGSLQQPEVQRATFGRLLEGQADALAGFALANVTITDAATVALSGSAIHLIARPTGNPADRVPGIVFSVTPAELAASDAYEVDDYVRVEALLASGRRAFVYVAAAEGD